MAIVLRDDGAPRKVFVNHEGVKIYSVSQDADNFLFSCFPWADGDESSCFDVRLFPEAKNYTDFADKETQQKILISAIDRGHLDKVGPRGFRVNVSFFFVKPNGKEIDMDSEMSVPVAELTPQVALAYQMQEKHLLVNKPYPSYARETVISPSAMKCRLVARPEEE